MKRSTPLAFVVGPTVRKKNHADDGMNSLSPFTSSSSSVYHQSMSSSTTTHLSLFSSSSSVTTAAAEAYAASSSDPAVVFDPIMPQTETLVGMGVIVLLSVIVSWVWANQVVPVSRTKLAIDKSRGELKEYLDELKDVSSSDGGGESITPTTTTTTTISQEYNTNATTIMMSEEYNMNEIITTNEEETTASNNAAPKVVEDDNNKNNKNDNNRAFEKWLFTDWLRDNKSARKAGRQKEPALPILKDAKWNSGDNPVIAASALIGLCVIVSSVVEKVVSSSF